MGFLASSLATIRPQKRLTQLRAPILNSKPKTLKPKTYKPKTLHTPQKRGHPSCWVSLSLRRKPSAVARGMPEWVLCFRVRVLKGFKGVKGLEGLEATWPFLKMPLTRNTLLLPKPCFLKREASVHLFEVKSSCYIWLYIQSC